MKDAGSKILFCLLLAIVCITSCKKEIQREKTTEEIPEIQYEIVSDTDAYNFINNVLLVENEIYKECPNLINRSLEGYSNIDGEFLEKMDSIFSPEDISYLKSQTKNASYIIWDKNKLKDKILIDAKVLESNDSDPWKPVEDFYTQVGCFTVLQIPLFNLKKDIAIVEVQYNYALDWGRLEAYIYKRNKSGKWKREATLFKIVS